MPRLEKCQSFFFTSVQIPVSPCCDSSPACCPTLLIAKFPPFRSTHTFPSKNLEKKKSSNSPARNRSGTLFTPASVAYPPPSPYHRATHTHSLRTRMYIFSNSGNLVNFTKLNWEHELSLPTSPIDEAEYLHHTLITIFLLESAAIYCSASLILQQLQREDAIYQQLSLRTIRFSAVAIIDACTILIHQVIFNAETQALYPLRLDALVLMCLNLLIFIFML